MIPEVATAAGAAICLTTLFNKKVSKVFKASAVVGLASSGLAWYALDVGNHAGSGGLAMVPVILGGAALSGLSTVFSLGGLVASVGKSSPVAEKEKTDDQAPKP